MSQFLKKVALLGGTLLLLFAVGEVSVRLSGYGFVGRREGNVVVHRGPEFEHVARLNSLDLRDEEIALKEPDEYRILALGDSFTYGLGVEEPQTFVRLVEHLLAERARAAGLATRVRVINAGVGKGPLHQSHWLQEVGLALEPDFVLRAVFLGNDLYDDIRTRDEGDARGLPGEVAGGGRGAARRSLLLDWLYGRLVALPGIDRLMFRAGYRYQSLGLFLVQQPELERNAWRRTLDELLASERDLEGRGIESLITIIPTRDQLRFGPDRPAGEDYRLPNEILTAFLTEHGIEWLDLLPAMEQAPGRDGFYYVRDLHWTAAGHEFAAERIAERLWPLIEPALRARGSGSNPASP